MGILENIGLRMLANFYELTKFRIHLDVKMPQYKLVVPALKT